MRRYTLEPASVSSSRAGLGAEGLVIAGRCYRQDFFALSGQEYGFPSPRDFPFSIVIRSTSARWERQLLAPRTRGVDG